jgi:DNA-binding NarL/FixJ family response regulator
MAPKQDGRDGSTPIDVLVVEDDPDVQFFMTVSFAMDSRFTVSGVVETAEDAMASIQSTKPGVIVLDHGLAGPLSGLNAAPRLKELAPDSKIILFSAHGVIRNRASREPAIDAFLLKTESDKFLPLAQQLTGLGAPPS